MVAGAGGLVVANWLRDALALSRRPRGGVLLGGCPRARLARPRVEPGVVGLDAAVRAVPALLTSNIDLAGALRSQSGGVVGARAGVG